MTTFNFQLPPLDFQLSTTSNHRDSTVSFTEDVLQYYDNLSTIGSDKTLQKQTNPTDKKMFDEEDDVTEDRVSFISTTISTQETMITDDYKQYYIIKEHELPSTSAAAVAAAIKAANKSASTISSPSLLLQQQQHHHADINEKQQDKSILRKSSAFFSQRVLKKKPSVMTNRDKKKMIIEHIEQRRVSNPGFVIKEQQPTTGTTKTNQTGWWRNLKNIIT